MSKQKLSFIDKVAKRTSFLSVALFMAVATLTPLLLTSDASAAQITARKLTLGSAVPSTATTYAFDFTVPTTGTTVKSFSADACTTAVGTCATPSGFSVSGATLTGQPTGLGNTTGWTVNTSTAGSLRMSNSTNASNPSGSQHVSFSGVTNPSTPNVSFFLRMTTYSDANWATKVDDGTTATAVVQSLTVNAAVAEVLNFCVGATPVDDDTTSVGANCGAIGGTSVDLGTLDTTGVNVSPVSSTTNTGNDSNGVAMLRTNAANGTTVSYDAIQQSGTNQLGTLRINGASCNVSVNTLTDQCIRAIGPAQTKITAGTENWGMTIAGTNCANTTSIYACSYSAGTEHLAPSSNYVGQTGAYCAGDTCNTSGNGFAWVDSTTATQIASSSTVVADEALILKFAATPSITTPFGAYQAQTDFIAVSTY